MKKENDEIRLLAENLADKIELDAGVEFSRITDELCGEYFISLLERLLSFGYEDEKLRKLFVNYCNQEWQVSCHSVIDGDKKEFLHIKYKGGYSRFFLFALGMKNYVKEGVRVIDDNAEWREFCDMICSVLKDMLNNESEELVKEMNSWRITNSKSYTDLVTSIFGAAFSRSNDFILEYAPKLCEHVLSEIWNDLDEREKMNISHFLMVHYHDLLESIQHEDLRNELEKYSDLWIMGDLSIESRERTFTDFETGEVTEREIIGRLDYGVRVFRIAAGYDKDQAINKFVERKIGYPLFIADDADSETFIDYVINVELNKNSYRSELKNIDINALTDSEFIWLLVCCQHSDNFDSYSIKEKVKNAFSKQDDLVEKIANAEIRFAELSKDKFIGHDKKLYLLRAIGTKKAFYKAWEMICQLPDDIEYGYTCTHNWAKIVTEWGEKFPPALVKKAVRTKNKACIAAIVASDNKSAQQFLFTLGLSALEAGELPTFGKDELYFDSVSFRNCEYIVTLLKIIFAPKEYWETKDDLRYPRIYNCEYMNVVQLMGRYKEFNKKAEYALPTFKLYSRSYDKNSCAYEKEFFSYLHENGDIDFELLKKMDNRVFFSILLERPFRLPQDCERFFEVIIAQILFHHEEHVYTHEKLNEIRNWRWNERSKIERRHILKEIDDVRKQKLMDELNNETLKKYLEFAGETRFYLLDRFYQRIEMPLTIENSNYLLARADDIFSTAAEYPVHMEYVTFLSKCRESLINKLLKNGTLQKDHAQGLIEFAKGCWWRRHLQNRPSLFVSEETGERIVRSDDDYPSLTDDNYYEWSYKELEKVLQFDANWEELYAKLEPEFMSRIFEKSILWVLKHRDSELWLNAPWFGMKIFNKSYVDRPSVWAKHLVKIASEWNGSEKMLLRICFALGHLREPLGGKVPIMLQKIADKQKDDSLKKAILRQRALFTREDFNKGHHRKSEDRVNDCKNELVIGQNAEV